MNKIKGLLQKTITYIRSKSNSVRLLCIVVVVGLFSAGCTLEFQGDAYSWIKVKEIPQDLSQWPNLERLSRDDKAQQDLRLGPTFDFLHIPEGIVGGYYWRDTFSQAYVMVFIGFDCFPDLLNHEVGHYWEEIDGKPTGYYAKPLECYGQTWGDHSGDN